ncbi:MAG TPA: HNH endonuclease signature motif containing protein [Acidimicrobiales bacterium]|nr:HNH endonuclease signature motif containing protein [Acidimicrobiales bacterium]
MKTLFALSNNSCAFSDPKTGRGCEKELTRPEWKSVQAEIAHICAKSPDGPRHDPSLLPDKVDDFDNLILLCPNHHHEIDFLRPADFPASYLREMKAGSIQAAERSTWNPTLRESQGFVTMISASSPETFVPDDVVVTPETANVTVSAFPPNATASPQESDLRRRNLIGVEEAIIELQRLVSDRPRSFDTDGMKSAQARMQSYLMDVPDEMPECKSLTEESMPWSLSDFNNRAIAARNEIHGALTDPNWRTRPGVQVPGSGTV